MRGSDGPGTAVRPDPGSAGTATELVEQLRLRKVWSGDPSYDELSRRTGLARSTLADALSRRRTTLPAYEVVLGIVAACGADLEEQRRWQEAWRGLRAGARVAVAPAQLPVDVAAFVGRDDELARLDALLADAGPEAVVVSAVSGTAGVGKTALAVHWSHRAAGRFPDGQLYVDLRGYDPRQPVAAAEALAGLLRALGTDPAAVPYDADERAAAYRSLLARKKVLIVLDNAAGTEQVRALLPGSSSCRVLVTSRDSLAGLVARDGVRRVDLDLLSPAAAHELLRTLVGARVDAEPAATALLVERCARLPLALRIAAELAVARPATTLAELAAELADERERLDLLDTGDDPRTAVRSVFSWSVRQLSSSATATFRLLALHPGPDTAEHGVAALAGTGLAAARRDLDTLTRAHLVRRSASGRYGMHDLLRAYAAMLAGDGIAGTDRSAALDRLYSHYLCVAGAAVAVLMPASAGARPPVLAPGTPAPDVSDPAAAARWLDVERGNLLALAVGGDFPEAVVGLSATLLAYLNEAGHRGEAVALAAAALAAARRIGDRTAEARSLSNLGVVHGGWGRFGEAVGYYEQAIAVSREVGDRLGEARSAGNLGNVHFAQGGNERARTEYLAALRVFRDLGDEDGAARALGNLSIPCANLGRFDEARGFAADVLDFYRRVGDDAGQAEALHFLGYIDVLQDRHASARPSIDAAVLLFDRAVSRARAGRARATLARACLGDGDVEAAVEHGDRALEIAREVSDRDGEASALGGLGEVRFRQGRAEEALALLTDALRIAREIGSLDEEAHLLTVRGDVHRDAGGRTEALEAYLAALAITARTGNRPEEMRARAGVAALGAADPARTAVGPV